MTMAESDEYIRGWHVIGREVFSQVDGTIHPRVSASDRADASAVRRCPFPGFPLH